MVVPIQNSTQLVYAYSNYDECIIFFKLHDPFYKDQFMKIIEFYHVRWRWTNKLKQIIMFTSEKIAANALTYLFYFQKSLLEFNYVCYINVDFKL